ncbi:reverse transcriptase-like protein [Bacillus xiapuensis]|uniref:reverse transcriptase-like protein n=1 Tax=Bacillus xiapuensis TaxID=2014075 RepID=UPI000C24309E|nr:reverse transcriptase-like protein [Bacillus xiapuensis]
MKMQIRWTYDKKGLKADFQSNWLPKEDVRPIIEDLQKSGRLKAVAIMDEMQNEWTLKEFSKLNRQLDEEPGEVEVYFDGGYDLQTGASGIGVAVYYKKNGEQWRLRVNERLMQLSSNNEAEYAALYRAVQELEKIGVKQIPVTIKGDSQVVLKQLAGEWPCFEQGLNSWLDRIEQAIDKLGIQPAYKPIERKRNKEADKLANQALQEVFVRSHAILS